VPGQAQALERALERAPALPEWQDPAWLKQQRWPAWREAFEAVHNPASEADLSPQSPARRRLAFDELFAHQLALAQRKAVRRAEPARVIVSSPMTDRVEADLPFKLTGAQIRTLAEIRGGERMVFEIQHRPHPSHIALEAPGFHQPTDRIGDAQHRGVDARRAHDSSSGGLTAGCSRVATRAMFPPSLGSRPVTELS